MQEFMAEQLSAIREDTRNMHVDMVRNFHAQQVPGGPALSPSRLHALAGLGPPLAACMPWAP